MRPPGSLLSCTYGSWYQVALDAPIEVTTLQLLVLATNLCSCCKLLELIYPVISDAINIYIGESNPSLLVW
jgi:hypothetical protein